MVDEFGIYKCNVCGNVVSVLIAKGPPIVCCGKEMEKLEEQTAEKEGNEKHVPVMEVNGQHVKVKVGTVEHPMEEGHYIGLIQLIKDSKVVQGARLKPGDKPEFEFLVEDAGGLVARELCNVHGLWKS